MRWSVAEYLCKGLFVGLLTYAALIAPSMPAAAWFTLALTVGLGVGLIAALSLVRRQGVHLCGPWSARLLFAAIEYPRPVYTGTLIGLGVGVVFAGWGGHNLRLLFMMMIVGLAVAVVLQLVPMLANPWLRRTGAAALAGTYVVVVVELAEYCSCVSANGASAGLCLLLGLPVLYLLTFISEAEESEAEAAIWCGVLAAGLWLLRDAARLPVLVLLIPATLYFSYLARVLPGLQVFKHTLRGIGYANQGLHARALRALHRALFINPTYQSARQALWQLHRRLQPSDMDEDLIRLIDPQVCLDRAASLLMEPPAPTQREEALQLLALAERREPRWAARFRYWRAVAATHAGRLDDAANQLDQLFAGVDDPERRAMLVPAWQLMLLSHPGLEARFGRPQLQQPHRRLEAIAAVERVLADAPEDATAWSLKRVLYSSLTLADYQIGPFAEFDHAYAAQLGQALIADPAQIRRGAEYLAMAAQGTPAEAPRLWHQIADAMDGLGDANAALQARHQGKQAGMAIGIAQLSEPARHSFFAIVKWLSDHAAAASDWDAAAANLSLFAEYDRSGLETLRTLADLQERRGDPIAALHAVERARLFNPGDPDLNQRRDRYVYSIAPAALASAGEATRQLIDVNYCLDQARKLVDLRDADAELLHWARHLTELARVLQPQSIRARWLSARVGLRLGERDAALQLLEDMREQKPAKFATSLDEESWRLANRTLADLYLDELDRPDLAVDCLQEFRRSSKSGADTLFKLGQAHERLNQRATAAKYYEQAASYEDHPLAAEAREAARRLRQASQPGR